MDAFKLFIFSSYSDGIICIPSFFQIIARKIFLVHDWRTGKDVHATRLKGVIHTKKLGGFMRSMPAEPVRGLSGRSQFSIVVHFRYCSMHSLLHWASACLLPPQAAARSASHNPFGASLLFMFWEHEGGEVTSADR